MSENLPDPEILQWLEAKLDRMPKLRREIFLAIRLDDASYAEIAERTGLSVEQVERHFAQGMLALRDALDGAPPIPWWKRVPQLIAGRWRR